MTASIRPLLNGDAAAAVAAFYDALPSLAADERPALLHGMGYNFEYYDGLFAVVAANVQMSMEATDYTARYKAMQDLLLPFCSEYGIEAGKPLMRTHRRLFADFFQGVTGEPLPERYPEGRGNAWLNVSRRWCRVMTRTLTCRGMGPGERAAFSLGYFWAIEHLSIHEMETMRAAWGRCGHRADYLDAHCEVEGDHDLWVTRAVDSLLGPGHPVVARAVAAHEAELAGYYRDLSRLLARRQSAVAA